MLGATKEWISEEYGYLVGATITAVGAADMDYGDQAITLTIRPRSNIEITDQDGTTYRTVRLEVWQDPEGNGPGYLAFSGGET